MADVTKTPAYINRNPLNLRPLPNGEQWQGQTGSVRYASTGAFCQFISNTKGIRAAVINMRSIVRLGRRTLKDVIHTWAPPSENDSDAYLRNVCADSGLLPTYDLSWLGTADLSDDDDTAGYGALVSIIAAMNKVEAGGVTVSKTEIADGIVSALNVPLGYKRQDSGNIVRTDVSESATVKQADVGVFQTTAMTVAGTAAPVVASVAGLSWEVVAIMAGAAVLVLGGLAVYNLLKMRSERIKMHADGIA